MKPILKHRGLLITLLLITSVFALQLIEVHLLTKTDGKGIRYTPELINLCLLTTSLLLPLLNLLWTKKKKLSAQTIETTNKILFSWTIMMTLAFVVISSSLVSKNWFHGFPLEFWSFKGTEICSSCDTITLNLFPLFIDSLPILLGLYLFKPGRKKLKQLFQSKKAYLWLNLLLPLFTWLNPIFLLLRSGGEDFLLFQF